MLLLYTSLSYGICTYVRTYTCTCDRCCLYLGCPRQPGVDVLLGEVITGTDTEQLVLINWIVGSQLQLMFFPKGVHPVQGFRHHSLGGDFVQRVTQYLPVFPL